jgi:NCAIR mutase (PurE)-related protein
MPPRTAAVERSELRKLLKQVRSGKLGVESALDELRTDPVKQLGFATIDLHRAVRRGFPEVVYGPGKTPDQIVDIIAALRAAGQRVLVTRVDPQVYEQLQDRLDKEARYHPTARALVVGRSARGKGRTGVVVITGGTADQPVAEEAALTAELMGNRVQRIFDVGVAGIHRLLAHHETLVAARVIVAVAGMDGVLPTAVAGITDCPVIGVPTSVGYGLGARGEAALMTMLNSCAAGLTVVNIDNGFGAGYAAGVINRRAAKPRTS